VKKGLHPQRGPADMTRFVGALSSDQFLVAVVKSSIVARDRA
jgi:hypothetical protein